MDKSLLDKSLLDQLKEAQKTVDNLKKKIYGEYPLDLIFLQKIKNYLSSGRRLSQSKKAKNYAPKIMKMKYPDLKYKIKDWENSLGRLIEGGAIKTVCTGVDCYRHKIYSLEIMEDQ
jgi:hypothetical protein